MLLEKNGTQQSSQQHARLFERSSESKSDTTRSTFAAASTVDATNATSASTHENWRGAPIGDGEDTIDSYHSYDHRPPPHLSGSNHDNDPRDTVLLNYTIYPCPNRGVGRLISGQDSRYYELREPFNEEYKEKNPKFVCDLETITTTSRHKPCVVYSFGSYDEISFEVGIVQATASQCEVHIFDPVRRPDKRTALKNHIKVYRMGLAGTDGEDDEKFKTLATIMAELGHSHIHILKIDVEGAEEGCLSNMRDSGVLAHVDQVAVEFHSDELMKQGLDILVDAGFGIVYARREDRCGWCTEVSLARIQ